MEDCRWQRGISGSAQLKCRAGTERLGKRTNMHPNGFIDGKTAAATALVAAAGVGLPPRRVPLLGLAAALLGPSAAIGVLTTVSCAGQLAWLGTVAWLLARLLVRDREDQIQSATL